MASSPRPAGGGEDNILARLERGGFAKTWKHARLAWSTLASILVIGLIGMLASLASENLARHRQPLLIEAKALPSVPMAASAAPQAGAGAARKLATVIIEPAYERVMVSAEEPATVPPLVMLKPPIPQPEPAPIKPPIAQARMAAAPPSSRSLPSAHRVVHRPLAAKGLHPKVAPPRALVAVAPARTSKPAVRVAPAAIDSDVALLSAIIIHSSRHAGERAQQEAARCGAGKKCAPLSPNAPD